MLIKEESSYDKMAARSLRNQHLIAKYGLENIDLIKDGEIIDLEETWVIRNTK